ncbi:MAG TPA: hypothetical protein VMS30_07660 [Phycisphaerales bacterium]|nr:hypothetical protein [Phycisphaerales bacterium]
MASMLILVSLAGCKPKDIEVKPPPLPANAPSRQALLAAHNERAARLATTYSDGVIELRWNDEHGRHSEQGDLELWQTTGNRTAARISKIGDVKFWLGSSAEQWWLFDLLNNDARVLHRGTHDQTAERLVALGVKPLALLDLLGITALAEGTTAGGADAGAVTVDPDRGAWVIKGQGRGGPLRMHLSQADSLPVHIELLDAHGRVVAASDLSRYESVPTPNTAVMARPKMPRTVDIHLEESVEGDMAGDVKIALNQTVGEIDPKQVERIFDLDRLIAALRPDRIEQPRATP